MSEEKITFREMIKAFGSFFGWFLYKSKFEKKQVIEDVEKIKNYFYGIFGVASKKATSSSDEKPKHGRKLLYFFLKTVFGVLLLFALRFVKFGLFNFAEDSDCYVGLQGVPILATMGIFQLLCVYLFGSMAFLAENIHGEGILFVITLILLPILVSLFAYLFSLTGTFVPEIIIHILRCVGSAILNTVCACYIINSFNDNSSVFSVKEGDTYYESKIINAIIFVIFRYIIPTLYLSLIFETFCMPRAGLVFLVNGILSIRNVGFILLFAGMLYELIPNINNEKEITHYVNARKVPKYMETPSQIFLGGLVAITVFSFSHLINALYCCYFEESHSIEHLPYAFDVFLFSLIPTLLTIYKAYGTEENIRLAQEKRKVKNWVPTFVSAVIFLIVGYVGVMGYIDLYNSDTACLSPTLSLVYFFKAVGNAINTGFKYVLNIINPQVQISSTTGFSNI